MGDLDWGKLGLVLMGEAMLSNSLIQFSVDGRSCVRFLLFDLRPNYGGVMKIMVTSIVHWGLILEGVESELLFPSGSSLYHAFFHC